MHPSVTGAEIIPTGDAWFAETVAVSKSVEVSIRRVAFRHGTDAELASLHAVEVPIEVERGSNRMPQLSSPTSPCGQSANTVHDHAWLVEAVDGTPIAVGYCWSNSAGDERVMECDVLVSRDRRREGIGSRLMALICDETFRDGRMLLTWSTFDRVPAAEAFSRNLGAHVARVNRTSELALADIDWSTVNRWTTAERARELGYSLEMIDGPYPSTSATTPQRSTTSCRRHPAMTSTSETCSSSRLRRRTRPCTHREWPAALDGTRTRAHRYLRRGHRGDVRPERPEHRLPTEHRSRSSASRAGAGEVGEGDDARAHPQGTAQCPADPNRQRLFQRIHPCHQRRIGVQSRQRTHRMAGRRSRHSPHTPLTAVQLRAIEEIRSA